MEQDSSIYNYAKRLKTGNYKYEIDIVHRREKAVSEAKRLAVLLISRIPKITKIWGFGSVFESNRPFSESSDIDLALEGGDFFAAFKIVENSSFKVDLIDITGKNDMFANLIREYGTNLLVEE